MKSHYLFYFFTLLGCYIGICIPWRCRLRDTGSRSQVTFANAFLQPGRASHCPEEKKKEKKKIIFLFFYGISPWDPFGCVNPSQCSLGLISAWHQLLQNLGNISLWKVCLERKIVLFRGTKHQKIPNTFQNLLLLVRPGCCSIQRCSGRVKASASCLSHSVP